MHRKTRTCSRKYALHLIKFADSVYYAFFFSQLVFKIMKVVSLKMMTNMYRDLRISNLPGITTFPVSTVPTDRFEEMSDLRFLCSQITCSYVLGCV